MMFRTAWCAQVCVSVCVCVCVSVCVCVLERKCHNLLFHWSTTSWNSQTHWIKLRILRHSIIVQLLACAPLRQYRALAAGRMAATVFRASGTEFFLEPHFLPQTNRPSCHNVQHWMQCCRGGGWLPIGCESEKRNNEKCRIVTKAAHS